MRVDSSGSRDERITVKLGNVLNITDKRLKLSLILKPRSLNPRPSTLSLMKVVR